ncbi:MAG: hypothetical protein AAF928_21315 [Myxococcota bacterium]
MVTAIARGRAALAPLGPPPPRRGAIVVGGAARPDLVRAALRLTGKAVPPAFCRISEGEGMTLVEETLSRSRRHVVGATPVVVLESRQRRWAAPIARRRLGHLRWMPEETGDGSAVMAALVEIMAQAPDSIIMVHPALQMVANEAGFGAAIEEGFRRATLGGEVVALGAPPPEVTGRDDYLVSFSSARSDQPRWRLVRDPSRAVRTRWTAAAAAAYAFTGVVVGSGRALLAEFEAAAPRLLRLVLEGAALGAPRLDTLTAAAVRGHCPLDFARNVLAFDPVLGVVVAGPSVGWLGLDNAARLATGRARRRSVRCAYGVSGASYRRRYAPGDHPEPSPQMC